MEDFIEVVFAFIAIGAGLLSSAIKAKKRREAEEQRRAASPVKPARKPAPQKPAHPYAAPAAMPVMAFGDVPGQVIAPTVHTHLQPDCPAHDAPGSLGASSPEGKDPCHEGQLSHLRSETEIAQEQPGLTLDWSGEGLVKAFVMQEVLTRPCQRHAR